MIFAEKYQNKILGEIPFDTNIMAYDFSLVEDVTKEAMRDVLSRVQSLNKRGNLASMQAFQEVKKSRQ
jgi:hypothetical protein